MDMETLKHTNESLISTRMGGGPRTRGAGAGPARLRPRSAGSKASSSRSCCSCTRPALSAESAPGCCPGALACLQINPPVKGGALFFSDMVFSGGVLPSAMGRIAAGHELPDLADRTLWDPIR